MSAPGDNLPRPATPGPWRGKPEAWTVYLPREGIGEIPVWLDNPQDAGAIAALPEWIAAHDAEREGRLRAEAQVRALEEALGEALEASREPRAEAGLRWAVAILRDADYDGGYLDGKEARHFLAAFGGGS